MDFSEIIGILAAILTTCSFFPQVIRTVRSQSANDLSSAWLVMMALGLFLWVVYGIYLTSLPIIVANIITLGCVLFLIWFKFTTR